MKRGCHVYVEKPLVRTWWEAERFRDVARACGVVTQMGNNGNGTDADALQRQAALETLVKGAEGYIVMLRGSTDVTVGKTAWVMAGTVGSVVPGWGFDASAATTAVNINPSTDLIPYEIAA